MTPDAASYAQRVISATNITFDSNWAQTHGATALVVFVTATVLSVVAKILVRRLEHKMEALETVDGESGLKRTTTITHALTNTFLTLIWVVALLIILGEFGVSLAPLIAGAGIVGVALGFGAQTLVRDGLSGFFILWENQFRLGDTVDAYTTAGVISGRIEALSLRVTSVRMFDGTLNYIPNGNIQVIANKSRGWARAIVDVRVAYDEDVDRVRALLDEVFEQLREGGLKGLIESGPEVLGIQTMASDALVVRVIADCVLGHKVEVERMMRERIVARLTEAKIRVPISPGAPQKP
jgi:small conductance mechanosensitive channel